MEAHTGAAFEIHYTFDDLFPSDRAVSFIITIDGRTVDLPIVRRHELHELVGHASRGLTYKDGSNWKVWKYEFAAMTIGEYFGTHVKVRSY